MTDYPDKPPESDFTEETPTSDATRPVTPSEMVDLGQTRRQTGTYRQMGDTGPSQPPKTIPPPDKTRTSTPTPGRVRATGQLPVVSPPSPPPYYPPAPVPTPRGRRERQVRQPRSKRDSGLYLPWWSLFIMLAFVGCMAFGALLVVNNLAGSPPPAGGLTPTIIVITATFTVGAPATQTPIPQPATLTATLPLPTIAPTGTLPPGNFAIGVTVQVVGVGPAGLNVRSSPGIAGAVSFLAQESEHYVIKDGPQTASGEEWWQIQDVNNPNRKGWAVRRYLTVAGTQ